MRRLGNGQEISSNSSLASTSAAVRKDRVVCAAEAIEPSHILDALPGPAWIVDGSLQVVQRNHSAGSLSEDVEFSSVFPAGLDDALLERLRSPQQQVGFHALLRGEGNPWLFSATLLPEVTPRQRLILAQPSALFDVPAQLNFDELLDSAFDGLMILNAKRQIVQINVRFQQMFGYTIEDLHGKTPGVLIPPGHEHESGPARELLDRGGVYHLEARRLRHDGTQLEVRVSSQPIASGRFRGGLVVVYRDLTEVNRNARYRNLQLEATRILATAATVEQAARELLPVIAEALGWDLVRLWQVCDDGLNCVHDYSASGSSRSSDCQEVCAKCTIRADRARDGHSTWESDFHPQASCTDGAHCRLHDGALAAFPIVDTQKQVLGVLELLAPNKPLPEPGQRELLEGVCAHLGQFFTRCQAELALAENEARFRTLAETAPTAIFIHADGVVLYANAAFESTFGYSRDEIVNHSIWPLFHPEDREDLQERARRRQLGEEVKKRWEARMLCKNSELRWIDYSAATIKLGSRSAILCAASDVTERRALEIQLRQTQKMEAIGRLAGGIAHDFNNLLMVINCCSEDISLRGELPEEVRHGAEEIIHAAARAAALTRQLLAFSRHQVVAPQIVDLNSVLTGIELTLRRTLGDDIVLRFGLESRACAILADPSQIEQVVMNLAVNARDAMPNGGELRIDLSSVSLDEASPQAGHPRSGSYAVLTVSDNGVGMNQEIQQRIFEPFFTTKHASKGTGLGLSTVYGIVKQSGGFITVDSQPHCGATFKLFLPIAAAGASVAADLTANQEAPASGSATILLVEDEEEVRAVLHRALIRDGYTVLEASGGAQALKVSSTYEGQIDLLLTDVVMSGMSGRDLADRLVLIRPGLKVLYVSGYNEDTVLQKGVVEGQVEFLAKPFSPSVLSRKVRQLISH
jgi:PAS domain S-box-containing protein